MQYLITIPDTPQSIALIDFMKSSGLVSKVKAIKNQDELNGTFTEKDTWIIPERTDEEISEQLKRLSANAFADSYEKNFKNSKKMF
jgi:hypothetical protein